MVLDTNIIIAYINGEARVNQRLARRQKEGVSLFISPITFAEVLSLPKVDPAEVEQITRFLQSFLSIPFDNQLAQGLPTDQGANPPRNLAAYNS